MNARERIPSRIRKAQQRGRSGPSCTADIDQTIVLGAHGPYRVHIVVVRD